MITKINAKEAVAYIRFARKGRDGDMYYVLHAEGKEISLFLGETPYEPFIGKTKHILLDYDFQEDGVNLEWSFYTINKDAIAMKQKENPNQEITRVRLVGFIQDSKQEANVKWNNYRLHIKLSEDWLFLEIFFFEDNLN
jgi:hypothetical protein